MAKTREGYFWLQSGEDGTTITGPCTSEQIAAMIKDRTDGIRPESHPKFVDAIPKNDKGYWMCDEHTVVLIKGEIVVPKPVETVVEYVLD